MNVMSLCLRISTFAVLVLCEVHSQPKLFLGQTKIDVGTIFHGDIKKIPLLMKNIGTDTLVISHVQTSCGCTSAKKYKTRLLPGELDTLEIQFNSQGFSGHIEKHVTIFTNDPVRPSSEAVVTGNVFSELEITPGQFIVWLGSCVVGKEMKKQIQVQNKSTHPITITKLSINDSTIRAEFPIKTLQPSESLSITLIVVPVNAMFVEQNGFFETDSKYQPHVPVRIGYFGTK